MATDSDSLMRRQADAFLKAMPAELQQRQTEAVLAAIDGDTTALNAVRQSRNAAPKLSANVRAKKIGTTLRLYEPKDANCDTLPLLIYFHGGGWTFGSLNSCARFCDAVASTGKLKVLAVDYRLAPEYPFPCSLYDCRDALLYAYENADSIGIDRRHISLGGDSSGGNLALSLASALVGEGIVESVVAFYPVTKAFNDDSASWHRYASGYGLDADLMEAFNKAYTTGIIARDPLISVGLESRKHLKNLPRTLLVAAGRDLLCDQGKAFAKAAGKRVKRVEFPEAVHLFITVPGQDEAFSKAVNLAVDFITGNH